MVLPHGAAADYPSVMVLLLLEILITAFVFDGFWVSATLQNYSTLAPATAVSSFAALAPMTGLGEHRSTQVFQQLIERSDYTYPWLLLLENISPSKIPSDCTSYYDGDR